MDYDLTQLTRLGRENKRLKAKQEELRPELEAEIRAAAAAGVEQVTLIELSGYTRNTVRLASMPPERREAERAKRRGGAQEDLEATTRQ
jgi:hypothetical protein